MDFNYCVQARTVKKFPIIYDIRKFTVFIEDPHRNTSYARQIKKYDFLITYAINCGLCAPTVQEISSIFRDTKNICLYEYILLITWRHVREKCIFIIF
jgi:hypothetical protein